nr:unnamed protein product [Digitaria exilis]
MATAGQARAAGTVAGEVRTAPAAAEGMRAKGTAAGEAEAKVRRCDGKRSGYHLRRGTYDESFAGGQAVDVRRCCTQFCLS